MDYKGTIYNLHQDQKKGMIKNIEVLKIISNFDSSFPTQVALFLMDTQGAFDHKSSIKESSILFALSLLLSSYQFFNLKTSIDSLHLQALGVNCIKIYFTFIFTKQPRNLH